MRRCAASEGQGSERRGDGAGDARFCIRASVLAAKRAGKRGEEFDRFFSPFPFKICLKLEAFLCLLRDTERIPCFAA